MIIDSLMSLMHGVLSWLYSILPAWSITLPPALGTAISFLKSFDQVLPVTETIACITLLGVLFTAMNVLKWSVKVVDYIADVIP